MAFFLDVSTLLRYIPATSDFTQLACTYARAAQILRKLILRKLILKADEYMVEIYVRQNNVDQALRALKKKLQNEGVLREMKARKHYEKPSEKRVREKAEAVRRVRKLARKRAQLEGLIPMKKKKKRY